MRLKCVEIYVILPKKLGHLPETYITEMYNEFQLDATLCLIYCSTKEQNEYMKLTIAMFM